MTGYPEFGFDDIPTVHFLDQKIGKYKLSAEAIRPYYLESVEAAARLCTEDISEYYKGSLKYNRALSRPVPYRDDVLFGLGLTAGPKALWDKTVIETVEMGLFIPNGPDYSFQTVAELKEDSIVTGALANPRVNDPQDLDSFMRGLHYLSQSIG